VHYALIVSREGQIEVGDLRLPCGDARLSVAPAARFTEEHDTGESGGESRLAAAIRHLLERGGGGVESLLSMRP
jgi:hypothetical protein